MVNELSEKYTYGGSPSRTDRTGLSRSKSTGPCGNNITFESHRKL
jgi:hypothetical protein